MSPDKQKIATKLKKLLDKARSAEQIGNAAEAAAFAAKAQEWLTKHHLTMSEVEFAALDEEHPQGLTAVRPKEHGIPVSKKRVEWSESLGRAIADSFFCIMVVSSGSNKVYFVGRDHHREMAVYVYVRLVREILRLQDSEREKLWWAENKKCRENGHDEQEARQYANEACLGFKAAFRNSFVDTVRLRLSEERKAARDEAAKAAKADPNSTALIRLDGSHKAVREWMKAHFKTSSASGLNGQWSGNRAGRESGYRHGSRASLGANGMKNGGTGPAQIGSGK